MRADNNRSAVFLSAHKAVLRDRSDWELPVMGEGVRGTENAETSGELGS